MDQNSVSLIFPHQLFKHNTLLNQLRQVYLVEETLFFNQYNFNKKKLVLHRASMKFYEHHLSGQHTVVKYIDAQDPLADVGRLITSLAEKGIKNIHYTDTADNWLESRLNKACLKNNVRPIKYPSPNFLNSPEDAADFFDKKKAYFQTDFYIHQRRQRNILLEPDGRPIGGKWTYDSDNRHKFPKNGLIPLLNAPPENEYLKEARLYVDTHFPNNYGSTKSPFGNLGGFYPSTHEEAERWLDDFLQHRFRDFGIYEDAMVANESFLNHSVLTPMLNIGLLNPQQIIDKALDMAAGTDIPLNSLEGFIRQVMGWREFIHVVYEREGTRQRTKNYWGFNRRIPHSFWKGNTGIHPVDVVIKKVLATGYTHHIERLMVMGNFFLLCEFHPDDVYLWFMEMYVDAYDWVMVPNTYGMTQFADGGLMMTKPYISGSNYLLKMGDWKKGDWQDTWDGLFWRFMHVHRNFFLQNPRLSMLVKTFDKMPPEKQRTHLNNAEQFLRQLDEDANCL
ncbi:cryptochrome/photolyase family protein [Mucilaginibacter sp. SMC90]|uniref:cryptochrome/photolyase family protein n=1 Tax=Mucilaginibacter sp. SMC90 TaxID=2929803 RepID=UPI001FB32361|nr:cryptochrome/photolyase family protein [Mucilaginibacter sp. SMC90]UOE48856.1 cryptochrome/photolyase family protein [Mucilaginibacter sp. SMC90]